MFKKILALAIFFGCLIKSFAQETLPNFTAKPMGINKAQISWQNPYHNCTQISVQKSYDSLRFFKTIFSPLSPELPVNGFVDNDYLPEVKTYYRIQYVLEDGSFYFSKSKVPGLIFKVNGKQDISKTQLPKNSILIVNDSLIADIKNPSIIVDVPYL